MLDPNSVFELPNSLEKDVIHIMTVELDLQSGVERGPLVTVAEAEA